MAEKVWEIPAEGKTPEELASAGVQALADFVREIGLPTTFTEMGRGIGYSAAPALNQD